MNFMANNEEHINNFYKELVNQLEYNINGQSPAKPHYTNGVETSFSSDTPNFFASHSRTEIDFPSYEPYPLSMMLFQPLDANGLMARGFEIFVQIPTDEYSYMKLEDYQLNYQDFKDWSGSDQYYNSSDSKDLDIDMVTYSRDFFEDDYLNGDGLNIIQATAEALLKLYTEYYKVDFSQEYNISFHEEL